MAKVSACRPWIGQSQKPVGSAIITLQRRMAGDGRERHGPDRAQPLDGVGAEDQEEDDLDADRGGPERADLGLADADVAPVDRAAASTSWRGSPG